MKCYINPKRVYGTIDPMISGHFIEHFHRQIYGASADSYNDIGNEAVTLSESDVVVGSDCVTVKLTPHSVNLIVLK